MKKNVLYLVAAVFVGLLCGYFIFGTNSTAPSEKVHNDHDHEEVGSSEMWTCSMHPQIMQPEPGDCPICGMDLIPAETGADGLSANEIKMTENAIALANIQTTIVGSVAGASGDNSILLSGKIVPNDENNAVQASYFDGRLERLHVNYEGQKIQKGQLLATIYSPNLVAAQQELLTTATLKESQPALYEAVRNKLKLWKLSDAQIAAIETTGKVKDNFPIHATVTGTVTEVTAREGDYVKQGQPILKVSNLTTVWAEFDAYENQISSLKVGQKIKVVSNAYAAKEFEATVSFVDPILSNATRTVIVRAILNNTNDLFKPGMFVTGKISGDNNHNKDIITVPASAVMWTGERSLVYVKTSVDQPIFEMREVKINGRNGENISIASGLQHGEEIVTNGTFTIDAAAQLQGKKSMMNKMGGRVMTGHEHHTGMEATSNKAETSSHIELEFSKSFQDDFSKALHTYLEMKDAFVSGEPQQITSLAKKAAAAFESLPKKDLGTLEKEHLEKSIAMFSAIGNSGHLEQQREHLVVLNKHMVAMAMNLKSPSENLYVQRCPMANSNQGAVWLSLDEEIRNPYFDSGMLTCGSVVQVIQ